MTQTFSVTQSFPQSPVFRFSFAVFVQSSSPMWWPFTTTKDAGVSTREDRQMCWEARDQYFACLDNVGVVKAGDESGACASENKTYEKNCAKSWVSHSTLYICAETKGGTD